MDALAKMFGVMAAAVGGIFIFIIFNTLLGGVAGWVVGLFFSDTILGIAGLLGVKGITMFQLGCFLGFVGGYLKTKVTVTESSK